MRKERAWPGSTAGTATEPLITTLFSRARPKSVVSQKVRMPVASKPGGQAEQSLGRVTAQNSPDTGITTFTHDAVGNVLASVDARGKTTRFTYDVLDQKVVDGLEYPIPDMIDAPLVARGDRVGR